MKRLLALRPRLRRAISRVRARLVALSTPGVVIGKGALVGRHCRFLVDPGASVVLAERCEIDDGTTLAVYGGGRLVLGPGAFVGHHGTLAARLSVVIGAGTFLAEMVSVRDHDHVVGQAPSSGAMTVAAVEIGSDVWLGAKATVLKGTTIGDRAVIGANAVVRGDVGRGVLAVGVPARVVGPAARADR